MGRVLGGLVALGFLVGAAAPAHATVGCVKTGAVLDITITGGDQTRVSVISPTGQIVVVALTPDLAVTCTNGPGSVTTINTINVSDVTVGATSSVEINDVYAFQPGVTAEGPDNPNEIEWNVLLGDGPDTVALLGTSGSDIYRAGANGVNPNVLDEIGGVFDTDVFLGGVDGLSMLGGLAGDGLNGQGGDGTGGQYPGGLNLFGQEGDDDLFGNDAQNIVNAGEGDDEVSVLGGDDFIAAGPGDDTVDGGEGVDTFSFFDASEGRLDLAVSAPQDTGEGSDTLSDLENVNGTEGNDVVRGNDEPNELQLLEGDDFVEGRGGDDLFGFGEEGDLEGADTVSYESAPAGVTVDLGSGDPQSTGGAGVDTFATAPDFVIGSGFADSLTGTAVRNVMTGGGGADTISALDGEDRLELRDGATDTGDCGPGNDTAIADPEGTDTLTACEIMDFAPFPPDTAAPAFIGRVAAKPKRFRAAPRAPSDFTEPAAVPKGTVFAYRLSESASVTFAFDRRSAGRRVGRRCRKPTRRNRGRRRCTRFVRVGARLTEATAGDNTTRFNGVVRRRALRPGRYRVRLVALDKAANRSAPATGSFVVVRPKPKRR